MKKLILLFLIVVFAQSVSAELECALDTSPYIESDVPFLETLIYWSCYSTNMSDYTCSSYIQWNSTLLQVNPKPKDVVLVGRVDKFSSLNKQVQVYFRPEQSLVEPGQEYEFGVWCGDGTLIEKFNDTITPVYRELDKPVEQTTRVLRDSSFILPMIIILFLFLLLLLLYKRTVASV